MNLPFKLIIAFLFLLFSLNVKSQTLTDKDFKLLIDGKTPDSTITISELLQMKDVEANFSWISYKKLAIIIDFVTDDEHKKGDVYDGLEFIVCQGHFICEDVKKLIKGMRPTNTITFQAYEATNKSGDKLNIQDLVLRIK